MTRGHGIVLALTLASCGPGAPSVTTPPPPSVAVEPSPAPPAASTPPPPEPSPFDPIEAALSASETRDRDAIIGAFHPALREPLAKELKVMEEDKLREVIDCLDGVLTERHAEPMPGSGSEYERFGAELTKLHNPGGREPAVVVLHEGAWRLIDTGC